MGKTEKTEKANKKQKHFWKDFKAELKKVIWPTRSQVVNNTIIVIIIVIIITAIVFVLDLCFEALNTYGIDKLKTVVQDSVVSQENTDGQEESGENSTSENNNEENTDENEGNNTDTNNEPVNDTINVENNVSE